mmetsp:Transcript_147267/g.260334  ORF Transcript_147267/g.260334 Transcript_147267/m.260334 type:complete len:622 (-) Transcript_147267:138-2003(-)
MRTSTRSATCLWLAIHALLLPNIKAVTTAFDSDIDTWNAEDLVDDMSLLQVQHEISYGGGTQLGGTQLAAAKGANLSSRPAADQKIVNAAMSIDSAAHVDPSTQQKLISAMVNDPEMLMSAISIDTAATMHRKHGAMQAPIWVPILVAGILTLIVMGFAVDYVSGRRHFSSWLKDVVLFDLPADRRNSYYLFGLALAISLATLQFAGPLRTAIFFDVVGADMEPIAKSLVLIVLLPIVMLYSIAVSILPSTRVLVIVVNAFYTVVFLFLTVMIAGADKPAKWVVWILYFAVETKGVILMPMIWSVIADVSTADLSKKAYPFTFFVMQIGGIGGSYIAIGINSLGGEVGLMLIQTVTLAIIGACTWGGVSVIQGNPEAEVVLPPPKDVQEYAGNRSLMSVGLKRLWEGGEGLWLLISRPYVFMAYFVSYATLVTRTILDYENAVLVKAANPDPNAQVAYFGRMTLIQNILIAIIALVGTRQLIELLNVAKVLVLLPIVSISCIAALCVDYKLLTSTVACILVSTVAYALNSPCKEILFVRTSRDIKYKAKSWSEMYGNNIMKILGAQVNLFVNNANDNCSPNCFSPVPTLVISTIWVGIWVGVALTVGWQFQDLDAKDEIVS